MTGWVHLSAELQVLVFLKCQEADIPTLALKNASLVCHAWRELALPFLFRTVKLVTPCIVKDNILAPLEFLFNNDHIRLHLRELHIINGPGMKNPRLSGSSS
jgi:hypothetical protein